MTIQRTGVLLRHICAALAQEQRAERPDQELMRRFAEKRDQAAFAEVVRRHGPMVLAVSRRVLHNPHDAEDVFQAAFLTLARKAAARAWRDSIANWLYVVTYRLALRVRKESRRRGGQPADRAPHGGPAVDPLEAVSGRELCAAVDGELSRLPERLRAGIVLCCLEGLTRDEAARALGWSLGTLKRRLEQGRALLRVRLEKRGFALPGALAGMLVADGIGRAAVPPALAQSVAAAAATGLATSARVLALTQAVHPAALVTRLRGATVLLLAACLVGGITWAVAQRSDTKPEQAARQAEAWSDRPGGDLYGDPLPPEALARLGTARFRPGEYHEVARLHSGWQAHRLPGRSGGLRLGDRHRERTASVPAFAWQPGHGRLVSGWETAGRRRHGEQWPDRAL